MVDGMAMRVIVACLLLAVAACDGATTESTPPTTAVAPLPPTEPTEPPPPRRDEPLSQEWLDLLAARLAEGRALWSAAGIDAYEVTYRSLGIFDCSDDVTTRVVPGEPAAIVAPAECSRADDANLRRWTVAELFDLVERGIAAGADRVSLDIHPELGYPTRAYVDPELQTPDEEQGAEVRSVQPIEP